MSKLLYVFMAVLAAVACAHKIPSGEGIEILTSGNLSLASTGDWLLILYAPWCPHCVSLLDKVPEIAEGFKKKDSSVTIGIINADAEPSIQMQFSMHGFPTLFFAHDGEVYEHPLSIGRAPDTLVEFATKGYKKYPPITGYKAPFGIVMRAFAIYSYFAISTYRLLEVYADKLQIPPMWFFCGAAVLFAVFVIILVILCSRCGQSNKKACPRKNASKKNDSAIAAPIVQRERAENPIEGAAIADTERVQEKVKEAKEEQKLRKRSVNEDKKAIRDEQKNAQKNEMRKSKNPPKPQQNKRTNQPKKGH